VNEQWRLLQKEGHCDFVRSHTVVTTGYSLEGYEELKPQGGRENQWIQNFGGKNLLGNIHLRTPKSIKPYNRCKWLRSLSCNEVQQLSSLPL